MKKSKVIQQKKNVPVMVGSSGDGDAGDSIEKIIYLHLKPFRGNNNIMNLIIHMIYIYTTFF